MNEPQYDEMNDETGALLKKLDDQHREDLAVSQQYCPICGDKVIESERYPIYVCEKDIDRATDENNRELVFGNASATGGFMAYYKDDRSIAEDIIKSHRVFIDGVLFHADERYMGGIVVVPISSSYSRQIDNALRTILNGTPMQLTAEVKSLLDYDDCIEITAELSTRLLNAIEEVSEGKKDLPYWEFNGNAFLPYPSWLSGIYRGLSIKSPRYKPDLDDKDNIVFMLAVLASLLELTQEVNKEIKNEDI